MRTGAWSTEETRKQLAAPTPIDEAAREAEALLVAAEKRRDELLSESEAEAERKAAEVIEEAQRGAKKKERACQTRARGLGDRVTAGPDRGAGRARERDSSPPRARIHEGTPHPLGG